MFETELNGDYGRIALSFTVKFIVAVLCGGLVGIERETSGKPAGVRTNILICLGSMLFTAMSFEMGRSSGGDSTRIAAQIVTGIGFLGAGAILHEKGKGITGMTTAAMIWMIAALGVMIGAGYMITAVVITAATTLSMIGLRRVEAYINRRKGITVCFTIPAEPEARQRLERLVSLFDDVVSDFQIEPETGGNRNVSLHFTGSANERHEFLKELYTIDGVRRREMESLDDVGRDTPLPD